MRIPFLLPITLSVVVGCGDSGESSSAAFSGSPPPAEFSAIGEGGESETLRQEGEEGPSAPLRVVFMGTSLTEGLGLGRPSSEAWPARVAELADSAGVHLLAVNAGLSGETSAGALRRVEWVLRQDPEVFVLEMGANDGLRGLSLEEMERNLSSILSLVRERFPRIQIALVAMEAPPNMGAAYTDRFREVFRLVASRHGAALTPFLLDGVAGVPELNQRDQIHPTVEGHRRMARNVWPVLDSLFRVAAER